MSTSAGSLTESLVKKIGAGGGGGPDKKEMKDSLYWRRSSAGKKSVGRWGTTPDKAYDAPQRYGESLDVRPFGPGIEERVAPIPHQNLQTPTTKTTQPP